MRNSSGLSDLDELKGVIRIMLREVKVEDPFPQTFTDAAGVKWTKGTGTPTSGYAYTSNESTPRTETLTAAQVESKRKKTSSPGAKPKAGASQPEGGFKDINDVIFKIYKKNEGSIRFSGTYSVMGISGTLNDEDIIKKYEPNSDKATIANIAVLQEVCRFLGAKAKEEIAKDGEIKNKIFDSFKKFITGTSVEPPKMFNEQNWNDLITKLSVPEDKPTNAITGFMVSLPSEATRLPRTLDGFPDYLRALAEPMGLIDDQAVPESGTSTAALLADFLASEPVLPLASNLKAQDIKSGKSLAAATLAVSRALTEKTQNVVAYEAFKDRISTAIKESLGTLSSTSGTNAEDIVKAWTPPAVLMLKFPKTEQGLVDFLKFTYVATRAGGETMGFDAAAKVGVTSGTDLKTRAFPENPLYTSLGLAGSIEAARVFAYKNTSGAELPTGYSFSVDIEDVSRRKAPVALAPDNSNVLAIGTGDQEALVGGIQQTYPASESNIIAQKIVNGDAITATIALPDGRVFVSSPASFISKGVIFTFPGLAAGAAAPSAEKASGPRKSPITTTTDRLEGARTYEGTTDPFKLQNVYKNKRGVRSINSPNVALQKFAPKDFDTFTLRVNNRDRDFILVPIQLRSTLQEARWEISFLQSMAPPDTSDAGVGYIALSEITWTYDDNYIKYGLGEPKIQFDRINYIPSPENADIPDDVKIISIEEAKRRGVPGSESSDPIRNAIGEYIGSTKNPVGEALYMQPSLNVSMNSFSVRMYSNVRTNPR